jgi:hypothetical protein
MLCRTTVHHGRSGVRGALVVLCLWLYACGDGSVKRAGGQRDASATPTADAAPPPTADAGLPSVADAEEPTEADAAPLDPDAAPLDSDAAPLDPDAALPDPDAAPPSDRDNDGIPDALDRCPDLADPDQLDTDDDGAGDLCDPAPQVWQARLVRQGLLAFGGAGVNETQDLGSAARAGHHRSVGAGLRLEGTLSP